MTHKQEMMALQGQIALLKKQKKSMVDDLFAKDKEIEDLTRENEKFILDLTVSKNKNREQKKLIQKQRFKHEGYREAITEMVGQIVPLVTRR